MGRFSKLTYLDMKLGHLPKFQKFHIYPFSTPGGKIELIFTLQTAVSEIQADFNAFYGRTDGRTDARETELALLTQSSIELKTSAIRF